MAIEAYCVENLHRLPGEIDRPQSELYRSMIALGVVCEERNVEMERQRRGNDH